MQSPAIHSAPYLVPESLVEHSCVSTSFRSPEVYRVTGPQPLAVTVKFAQLYSVHLIELTNQKFIVGPRQKLDCLQRKSTHPLPRGPRSGWPPTLPPHANSALAILTSRVQCSRFAVQYSHAKKIVSAGLQWTNNWRCPALAARSCGVFC